MKKSARKRRALKNNSLENRVIKLGEKYNILSTVKGDDPKIKRAVENLKNKASQLAILKSKNEKAQEKETIIVYSGAVKKVAYIKTVTKNGKPKEVTKTKTITYKLGRRIIVPQGYKGHKEYLENLTPYPPTEQTPKKSKQSFDFIAYLTGKANLRPKKVRDEGEVTPHQAKMSAREERRALYKEANGSFKGFAKSERKREQEERRARKEQRFREAEELNKEKAAKDKKP